MRTERVEREVTKTVSHIYYIAEDGTKFDDDYDCRQYEQELQFQKLGIKVKDGYSFDKERGKLYYIPSEEAYHYVNKNIWWDTPGYSGRGWYLRIIHEEAYIPNWDEIYYMPKYIKELEKNLLQYKQEMHDIMWELEE